MALPLAAFVLLLVACGGGEAPIAPVAVLPTTVALQPATTAAPATTVVPVTVPATTPATVPATTAATTPATRATVPATAAVSYANCTAVRNAGAAPIRRGQPGYGTHLDRDGDGIGCET